MDTAAFDEYYSKYGPNGSKTASQIASEICTTSAGVTRHFNNAVLGWEVKDDIVKLAIALLGYGSKSMAVVNELEALNNVIQVLNGNVKFEHDVNIHGDLTISGGIPIRQTSYDGEMYLEDQTVNTVCRVAKGSDIHDPPPGVDFSSNYAWVFTFGGLNRVQYLFTPAKKSIFYRFKVNGSTPPWKDWVEVSADLGKYLSQESFTGINPNNNLKNMKFQPVNTVCRIAESVEDPPDGVSFSTNNVGWLFTVGGLNKMQYLFDLNTTGLYHRSFKSGASDWEDWTRTSFSFQAFIGAVNGVTKMENQPPNTMCRISKISLGGSIPAEFDLPPGVDLEDDDRYIWLYTVGRKNRNNIQVVFYSGGSVHYRFGSADASGGIHTRWSRWFTIGGNSGGSGERGHLKFLCIGNSFNQSSIAYVPVILSELLPNYDLVFGSLHEASATNQKHVDMYEHPENYDHNGRYQFFNYWPVGATEWDRSRKENDSDNIHTGITLKQALKLEDWDVILFQGTSEQVVDTYNSANVRTKTAEQNVNEMISATRKLLRIVQKESKHPFMAVWGQQMGRRYSWPRTISEGESYIIEYNSRQMYEKIRDATNRIMNETGMQDYIPVGSALEMARTNSLFANFGEGGNMLWSDGKHLNAGLPVLLAGYCFALKLLEWSGNKSIGIYNSSFVPTAENACLIHATIAATGNPGMTHGYPQLGSDAQGILIVDGRVIKKNGQNVIVDVEDETAHDNIRALQEIAAMAINQPSLTVVPDCSDIIVPVPEIAGS